MAIGTSLDMRTMLRPALSAFLRKLNCSAGGIFIQRSGVYSEEPEYAIPRNRRGNDQCRNIVASLIHQGNDLLAPSPLERLPIQGGDSESGYHYIHELPDVGFIALVKQSEPLDPRLVRSLPPLLQKLSAACQACLQNEELTVAHQQRPI